MPAKRIFYACAAVLCLVLAYHLGATIARGQGAASLAAGAYLESHRLAFALATDGRVFARGVDNESNPWGLVRAFPVSSRAVGLAVQGGGLANPLLYVFTEDGTVYECAWTSGPCLVKNVFADATTAQRDSWGNLKARYRQ